MSRRFMVTIWGALAIFAVIQIYTPLYFFGSRLNLVLTILIVSAFFIEHVPSYVLLLLFSSFMMRYAPGANSEVVIMSSIALILFWLRMRVVARGAVMNILCVALGTFGFYLLANPHFVYDEFAVVAIEALGNCIIGAITFELLRLIYETSTRATIRRVRF